MNVLVINGHPRENSFCKAIADGYSAGAMEAGANLIRLNLSEITFDLNVNYHSPKQQLSEQCILDARHMIAWADHLVFVYPTWWGTVPALLKGFIDRVLTEGFAFNEIDGGTGYAPLLRGKTAQLITTMDTPYLVYQLIYRAPGHNAMRRSILEFCGFEMAATMTFGPVRGSTMEQRTKWIEFACQRGSSLRRGALSITKRIYIKTMAWLKAIRLQFYPMTAVAYGAGAWAAEQAGYNFQSSLFWHGYAWIFFLEVATVLINEYVDYRSDKENHYFGPFTGGSRVMVDKILSFTEVRNGIIISLVMSFILLLTLLSRISGSLIEILAVCSTLIVLALGYTAPPLKLSYRTFGEITVGITHSFSVILCGYLFMGGKAFDAIPWMLSLPLFLSVLPSITLAGIPDHEADMLVNKRTLAVRFGKKGAAWLALSFVWLSVICITLINYFKIHPAAFSGVIYFAVPHALLLTILLRRYLNDPAPPQRIDYLLIAALVYLVWFALIPLINLA